MKYFSTFTGIGGMELGIGPEHECVGYSEVDKYAIQIYKQHFPTHHNYGDITKINADALPDFDLLVGGFPCQSFSIAGKRGGFADTRGTLFFDLARILNAKKPRLFLFENVKGLLSHDSGRTFATIVTTLTELGYDLQWQVLNSKNHGVPQNRERIFIAGHLRGTPRPEVFPFTAAEDAHAAAQETGEEVLDVAQTLTARQYANWSGNFVDQIAEINKGQSGRIYSTEGISPTLSTMSGGGLKQPKILQRARGKNKGNLHTEAPTLTGKSYQDNNHVVSVAVRGRGTGARVEARKDNVANALRTATGGSSKGMVVETARIRRLTPVECERLQGFPDNWTEGVSDTQRYKTLGNAVTVNVIEDIMARMLAQ